MTTMDRTRDRRLRPQPTPTTWEIPFLLTTAALVGLLLSPLVAQGLWCLVLTGSFAWPTDPAAAVWSMAHGIPGVGLDRSDAQLLPSLQMLGAITVAADIAAVALIAKVSLNLAETLGASPQHGLATRRQARRALGTGRLRRAAKVIRPDLQRSARPAVRSRLGRSRRCADVGWLLGRAGRHGPQLWVPYDRTSCVIGPQGSGKTLDLLVPAILDAPGGAIVTLTKPDDLFLTIDARRRLGPVVALDPFDLAGSVPELIWDPIDGCADAGIAERRAKAFAAGTMSPTANQTSDQAARFYAGECAKVLQAYFHAAALADLTLDDVLRWISNPLHNVRAEEILRTHPDAEPLWDGLLRGALFGDSRTAGNTITSLQHATALFFQTRVRRRCVPSPGRPASDIAALIRARATFYLLGREDPYASATPLMTAVTEHILDTAKHLGETSPHGRLCPPFLACLDELPSTAPIPTLATRLANERALGTSFVLAAQTWRQLVVCYGDDEARTILGLSNNLITFGGGKDIAFYRELADLIGDTTIADTRHSRRAGVGLYDSDTSWGTTRVPILEPSEIRRLPERQALVLPEASPPLVARLTRSIEGTRGKTLLAAQRHARRVARVPDDAPGQEPTGHAFDHTDGISAGGQA